MRSKWYIEFPLVLLTICAAVFFALNVNLPSCNKALKDKKNAETLKDNAADFPGKAKWLAGKDMFKANCAACHNPKANGVGPVLIGVTARWKAAGSYQDKTGEQWLKLWIHNWNDVVAADYKYGVEMANSRPAQMNTFPYLTDEQVDEILFYIEAPDLPTTSAQKTK